MADTLGDAKIGLEVELDNLRKGLAQAQTDVETMLKNVNKNIELNVQSNFDEMSEAIKIKSEEIADSFKNTQEKIEEINEKSSGAFSGMSSAVEEFAGRALGLEGVFSGMLPSIAAVAGGLALVTGAVVGLSVALILSRENIRDHIEADKELSDSLTTAGEFTRELSNTMQQLFEDLKETFAVGVVNAIKSLSDMWNQMNATTGAGDNLLNSIKNLLIEGMEALIRITDSVVNLFGTFVSITTTTDQNVNNLGVAVNTTASGFQAMAGYIQSASSAIEGFVKSIDYVIQKLTPFFELTQKIAQTQRDIIFLGTNRLIETGVETTPSTNLSIGSTVNNPDPGNFTNYGQLFSPGTQEDKNKFNQYQAPKSKGGSKSESKEKEIDLGKEEKKILDDLISGYEDEIRLIKLKIELGEANKTDLLEILNLYHQSIEARSNQLSKEGNINEAALKELELRKQIKQIEEEDFNQRVASQQNEIFHTLRIAAEKERLRQVDINAENALTRLKLQNEGDSLRLKLFDIDIEYQKKEEKLKQDYEGTKKYEELKRQLKISKQKEVDDLNGEGQRTLLGIVKTGYDGVISTIGTGFSNMWTNVFGEANSLFEQFAQYVESKLLELATSSIFESILGIFSGGITSVFSGIGKFIGGLFGGGGFTGKGADDEPAGIVHRNEFVVSSLGTSIPANRELLEAMNRGEDVLSLIGGIERRNVDSESIRAGALSRINTSGFGSGERSVNVNIGGLNVNTEVQKLTGLSENDWTDIVDNEIIPQISKGLKRAGKPVLDNSIN